MSPRTPSPPSCMEVEALCFGGVSLLRGQINLTAIEGNGWMGPCTVKSRVTTSFSQPGHLKWVMDGSSAQQCNKELKIRVAK